MHVDAAGDPVLFYHHFNMGLFFSKLDQLPVLAAAVGFCRAAHVNRLQNIGLSLGIVAVKNIGSLVKINMQLMIISII